MRKLSLTTAERARLMLLVEVDSAGDKISASLTRKLTEMAEPQAVGTSSAPLELALIEWSRGKVVPLNSGMGYARASKTATSLGATATDCKVVGQWIARQGWLRGSLTLIDVLAKWPQWFAKARAEQGPTPPEGQSAKPGFR